MGLITNIISCQTQQVIARIYGISSSFLIKETIAGDFGIEDPDDLVIIEDEDDGEEYVAYNGQRLALIETEIYNDRQI